jgi:hypothetical protein
MITFKEYLEESTTKTEQELMSRSRTHNTIYINGKQEHDAAKKYVDASGLGGDEYYVNPFTKKHGITKTKKVYGGTLHFHEK